MLSSPGTAKDFKGAMEDKSDDDKNVTKTDIQVLKTGYNLLLGGRKE